MLTHVTSHEVRVRPTGSPDTNSASPVIAEILAELAALSRKFTVLERALCYNPSAGRARPLVDNLYCLSSAMECLLEEHRRAVLGYVPRSTNCTPQTPDELRQEARDLLTRALANLDAPVARVIDAAFES